MHPSAIDVIFAEFQAAQRPQTTNKSTPPFSEMAKANWKKFIRGIICIANGIFCSFWFLKTSRAQGKYHTSFPWWRTKSGGNFPTAFSTLATRFFDGFWLRRVTVYESGLHPILQDGDHDPKVAVQHRPKIESHDSRNFFVKRTQQFSVQHFKPKRSRAGAFRGFTTMNLTCKLVTSKNTRKMTDYLVRKRIFITKHFNFRDDSSTKTMESAWTELTFWKTSTVTRTEPQYNGTTGMHQTRGHQKRKGRGRWIHQKRKHETKEEVEGGEGKKDEKTERLVREGNKYNPYIMFCIEDALFWDK